MEFKRLFDIFDYQLEHHALQVSLAGKVNDQWVSRSTAEIVEQCRDLSNGLYRHGIRPGDKVAIIATNRPEWCIADVAIMGVGAINIPVYPNISIDDYRYIFNDAEVKIAFVGDKALYSRISSIQHEIPSLERIYTFTDVPGTHQWTELLLPGDPYKNEIEAIKASIKPDDLATIIYTSGTTGTPKGVMLSHNNIVSNVLSAFHVLPLFPDMRILSSLPLCHIFERMVCYVYMYVGVSIYFAEKVENMAENLKDVKPHFFTTVPRLLEKMYEKILQKGNDLQGIKKTLFDWSLRLAEKYEADTFQGPWYELQLYIARKLVFKKWQEALGGHVVGIVTGAAALQPRLARVFNAAGIKVREGYGQTESSPAVAVNDFKKGKCKIGTVGPPLPGVQVKIAEDGEICIKGPLVMLGYYKQPELTAQVIDEEGWLHTGDIGALVDGTFLKITDRKKELFKTSGGKYVAPQVIENKFKESFLIDQIMVVGENKKTVSALIVPSLPSLTAWCEQQGLAFKSKEEMLKSQQVIKKYAEIRDEFNKRFSDVERVKKFVLMLDEWTVDSGEITPTLKLKRKVIQEKYKRIIAELYNDEVGN
jgi:long-chain acyl-CoA synthetase